MNETTPKIGFLYDPTVQEHRTRAGHPERPARVTAILEVLQASDVWPRLTLLAPHRAAREELERVHTAAYVSRVERVCALGGGLLDAGDTEASPGSWQAATAAAGSAIATVDAVMTGELGAAFTVVRPPGHHAVPDSAMGFCIFGNVAVAAAHALEVYGLTRVLIVDFDVHHGNGTQDTFYAEPRVLFFSTHQSPAYPGTGGVNETGVGPGLGFTVNVPLPSGVPDAGFEQVFAEVLRPLADRFRPELILVSAGYDAHWRNSQYVAGISEQMTVAGYFSLSRTLWQIAQKHCPGRLVGILEGGYDLDSLAYGVLATLRAWLGDSQCDDPIGPNPGESPKTDVSAGIERVRRIHSL